jgi:hypothetical protein
MARALEKRLAKQARRENRASAGLDETSVEDVSAIDASEQEPETDGASEA